MTWNSIDEQPLVPGASDSPKALTESKDVPGEIRMFRGTTSLAFGASQVAVAVSDPAVRMQWVERMSEDRLIEGTPEDGEWLSYEAYDLVWPVSNRDYVFRQTMKTFSHEETNRTVVQVESIEHPDYPEQPGRVRGALPSCVFTLDEVGENETRLEVVVQVDPGGSLPGFVKNLIQKGWALKTMRALNTYLVSQSA